MNLIALLIGLVIERLASQLFHWRRMRWLDRIIDFGFHQSARLANWPALIPVIVIGVILVLPVFAVIWFLGDTLAGFTYLLLAIVVLFFSLGPRDIGEEVARYCKALEADDEEEVHNAAKAINVMAVGGFRRVPVLSVDDRVIGIIGPKRTVGFLRDYIG